MTRNKALYVPANGFWSHLLHSERNRPINHQTFESVQVIEMNPNHLRVSIKDQEWGGFVDNGMVDGIPGVESMTNAKKLKITNQVIQSTYTQNRRILGLLSRLPCVETLEISYGTQADLTIPLRLILPQYKTMFAGLKSLVVTCIGADSEVLCREVLSYSMPRLERLELKCSVDWAEFSAREYPALKELSVERFTGAPSLRNILARLPGLEKLKLGHFSSEESQESQAPVESALRDLTIRGGVLEQLNVAGLESLHLDQVEFDPSWLSGMTSLRDLGLNDCLLEQPIPDLRGLHELERLELRWCTLDSLELIRGLNNLKALKLERCFWDIPRQEEEYPPQLAALETLTGLLSLTVNDALGDFLLQPKLLGGRFRKERQWPVPNRQPGQEDTRPLCGGDDPMVTLLRR